MESLDIHAPFDAELNPTVDVCTPAGASARKRKSRWDVAPETVAIAKVPRPLPEKIPAQSIQPTHWEEIHNVGGNPLMPGKMGRTLAQKILFADAICGTSTSNFILDQVINL